MSFQTNIKVKKCKGIDCLTEFRPINSLQKYCSKKCLLKTEPPKAIKKMSDKRSSENQTYLLLRKAYLIKHPICEVATEMCSITATEIHHKKGRINDLLCDIKYFIATCRICHQQVEENPEWAKKNGFSLDRLSNE